MPELLSRRRVEIALSHQEPDRVPWDCTFTIIPYLNLMKYLGLPIEEEPKPNWASAISPSVRLLQELQADLCYVGLSKPTGAPVFEYGREKNIDEWGIVFRKVVQPNGTFEYFFDEQPLAHATIKDLENFPWPDPYDPARVEGLENKCRHLYEETGFAPGRSFQHADLRAGSLSAGFPAASDGLRHRP